MPTATTYTPPLDMDPSTWQAHALVALDHIAEQRRGLDGEPVNSAAIEDLLAAYDDVVFDFSPGSSSCSPGLRLSWYNLVVGNVTDAVHSVNIPSSSPSSSCGAWARDASGGGSGGGFVASALVASFKKSPVDLDGDDEGWEHLDSEDDDEVDGLGQGPDIQAVYEWCIEQARGRRAGYSGGGAGDDESLGAGGRQNVFRFEFGRYASSEMRRRLMVVG
ncbi:uncharacterized protein B0I36DRAFT_326031 [Microdochium trichocladiopsis]|uniref:Uncharacterized protein n=1 Tax=Microdochium trichocladiopsis TaxID=1682393 RepID=A0A9P8Y7N0_9PEZI|nr:uncharacterized protein B0I36DRAFT_326031 [Microdochium trichocladiopsis]KAH7029572.1 hypothetical protein B0I36DRAFT_326031 [Microdochium trichocladiopsis]